MEPVPLLTQERRHLRILVLLLPQSAYIDGPAAGWFMSPSPSRIADDRLELLSDQEYRQGQTVVALVRSVGIVT